MIQIQNPNIWRKAADRLTQEPQSIRRHEAGLWLVTNKNKGTTYAVRVERKNGKSFITCGCEAGSPRKNHMPLPCKHAAAVILFLRGVREMRRRALSH
jgi:hypothetical protein